MAKDIFGNEITHDIYGNPLKPKNERKAAAGTQRKEVLARQKNRCNRCHKMLDMRAVHFDHIKPVSAGGEAL